MKKLAIKGGQKVVPDGLIKPWPWITSEDIESVSEVLKRAQKGERYFEATAPTLVAAQKEWAEYVGAKYCVITNSGTAALHMAVAAAGVEPGDEVIVPAFTFIASASCVLHHNGIPVFVDIDPGTFTLDPEKIEEKITPKTKAIIPVHIHGLPADMDKIMRIAKKHNLVVIEDAAQAPGAEYHGEKVGTIGDMGCFSLNGFKNLQAGEGGFFVTNEKELIDKATMVRVFGEVIEKGKPRVYDAFLMGWMYRPNGLTAALASSQLKQLDKYNEIRIKNCEYLTKHLEQIPGIEPPFVPPDRKHVYWMYVMRLKPTELGIDIPPKEFRKIVQKALIAEGVPVGQWQTMPVPAQTLFRAKNGYGKGCPWSCPHARKVEYKLEEYPETNKLIEDYLRLGGVEPGIEPPNDLELMKCYVEAFNKVLSNIDQIID